MEAPRREKRTASCSTSVAPVQAGGLAEARTFVLLRLKRAEQGVDSWESLIGPSMLVLLQLFVFLSICLPHRPPYLSWLHNKFPLLCGCFSRTHAVLEMLQTVGGK